MTDNKTRRNFLIGSVAVPGSIAAAAALTQESSNAETPTTETEVTAVGTNIDANRLSRFQKEVQEKAIATLDLSDLFMMLDKYGFPERAVKVEVKIMLDEMREHMNNRVNQQQPMMKDSELEKNLMAIYGKEVMIQDCYLCPGGYSCG
ncbi:hypothetical protein [Mastigocoleus sp. MO_188.B34]|uniref:hypothetical protein n=1 Tax=Mastigocoleus sp. MO_188.B34 TaxID=3036635 RepID=UPI0026113C43|nr:hypothetical protein [Mastigocoleus sp. MO_188.B34]MDJ0698169.1 hypothetical protein [Mastigocoleus sp. MO_188.B34]